MNTSESFEALRRANPRADSGFAPAVAATRDAVRARVAADPGVPEERLRRGGLVLAAAVAVTLTALAALAATLSSGPSTVESATAAVKRAATVTAASAERSGVAVVRMTHDGELWAGRTIRWNSNDLALSDQTPGRGRKPGFELLVVDGMMYGIDPGDGRWVKMGSPDSIDPDSGTTPAEHLAATREDVGGVTLRRLTRGMTGLTTRHLDDGSTVYSGSVAAGLIARETGFKEGQALRVLPFGYVAHDEAADPAAPLGTAVTVGPEGIVREISVAWGTWTYTVAYSRLGSAPTVVAPKNARDLLKERMRAVGR
jgi:hypothetical protein